MHVFCEIEDTMIIAMIVIGLAFIFVGLKIYDSMEDDETWRQRRK